MDAVFILLELTSLHSNSTFGLGHSHVIAKVEKEIANLRLQVKNNTEIVQRLYRQKTYQSELLKNISIGLDQLELLVNDIKQQTS